MSDAGKLKNGSALLHDIAAGLSREGKRPIDVLEVVFVASSGEYVFALVEALSTIANDLYWDERGNWADAHRAIVRVL